MILGEINDTRVLLDEQNEKNELLERKFRKVDAELMEVRKPFINLDNYGIDPENDDKDGSAGGNDGRFLSIP